MAFNEAQFKVLKDNQDAMANLITEQIAKAVDPIKAAVDAVDAVQARNALALEEALNSNIAKINEELADRIEAMRAKAEEYSAQQADSLGVLKTSGK